MTSQELFDKWYSEKRLNITYSAALQIWNASREAIEINMPPKVITAEIGPAVSHEKMAARLAVQGITVKGE